jgi:chorismate mutase/prephenate dehydratase
MKVGNKKPGQKADIVYRPEREAQIFRRLKDANNGPLESEAIERLFREIISICRATEAKPSIATLGPDGTFSELATRKQFGAEIDLELTSSIEEVFRLVEADHCDIGVVPVENSAEGGIHLTLDRLLTTSLKICGEVDLRIKHCLIGSAGNVSPTRVLAHQQALAQCRQWLDVNLPSIERVACASNSDAVRQVLDDPTSEAIAAGEAADAFGLQILQADIEDQPGTTTRFLVLGRHAVQPSGRDKTSLVMSAQERPGALHTLLAPLSEHNINMTRVESRPSRTGLWEYMFFIDIEGHRQESNVGSSLSQIKSNAAMFKILGSYPRSI